MTESPKHFKRNISLAALIATILISGCADLGDPLQPIPSEDNTPPALQPIGMRYTSVNNLFQVIVIASDSESTPTLTALNLPASATFIDSGNGHGLFSWTAMPIHANTTNTVTFIATDDSLASAMENVDLSTIDYTYNNFIGPEITGSCAIAGCHGNGFTSSGFSAETYQSFLAGGSLGSGVAPRDTASSIVFQRLQGTTAGSQMPLGGPPFVQSTLDSIAVWILAGAPES